MAFAEIARLYERDPHFPIRTLRLKLLTAFRDGSFFDVLPYPFQQETTENTATYIPLRQRRPAAHVSWANEVLQDVAALLFGEGHFPEIESDDEDFVQAVGDFIEDADLRTVFSEAVYRASVGSAVLFVRFLGKPGHLKPIVTVEDSTWFTPEWDKSEPWKLFRVVQRYKVKGSALREMGYAVSEDDLRADFWWKTEWTENDEIGYVPVKVETDEQGNVNDATNPDPKRSVHHALGRVPAIWITLPGGDKIDGRCLFATAMDTIIEADYQLSQLGRGLKYSQDPLKVISLDGDMPDDFKKIVAGSDLLVLPNGGDAKLLETSGESARAVMEYVSLLRRYAVRAISGSPIDPERVTVPQSGRAMEILNLPLIQLADRLRNVFGHVLMQTVTMVFDVAKTRPVEIKGKKTVFETIDFRLRWPAWYPPTATDRLQDAQSVTAARQSQALSQESAVKFLAAPFDVESVDDELKKLQKEQDDNARRAQQQRPDTSGQQTA